MAEQKQAEKYVAVKKVDPVSIGKYLAGIYLLIFMIIGAFMIVGGLFALIMGEWELVLIGLGVATLGAAFYAMIGFVAGVIGGFIYNVVASKMGGIRIVLE
jgi:hypothetical protein